MQLTTLSKVNAWDSFWQPVIGLSFLWLAGALLVLCTPDLFINIPWKVAFLACICLIPLAIAWWLRAREKRGKAHAFVWLHLLIILGGMPILDNLGG